MMGPNVVIITPAQAYDFITNKDIIEIQFWATIGNLLFLAISILFSLAIIRHASFRQVRLSVYQGIFRRVTDPESNRWYIIINLRIVEYTLWSQYEQEVHVRIPINQVVDRNAVRLEVTHNRNLYKTARNVLQFAAHVHLRPCLEDGCYVSELWQDITIDTDSIRWKAGGKPIGLNSINYGEGFVQAIENPGPQRRD